MSTTSSSLLPQPYIPPPPFPPSSSPGGALTNTHAMSHLVYKKQLRSASLRDDYKVLRMAKDSGMIDREAYQTAKRNLLDGSEVVGGKGDATGTGGGGSKTVGGRGVATLVYKPEMRDAGEREARKERKFGRESTNTTLTGSSVSSESSKGSSSRKVGGFSFFGGGRKGSVGQGGGDDDDGGGGGGGVRRRAGSLGTIKSSSSGGTTSVRRRHPIQTAGFGGGIDDMFLRSIADYTLVGGKGTSSKSSSSASRPHSCSSQGVSFSSSSIRPESSSSRLDLESPPISFARDGRLLFPGPDPPPTTPTEPLPLPPSPPLLLDLFTHLLATFSDASNLFRYAKYSTLHRDPTFARSRSVINYDADDDDDSNDNNPPTLHLPESHAHVYQLLEKRAWFLSAMKWLSFERVLFSPGHHLLSVSHSGSILDLDGGGIATRSWHLSQSFPTSTIHTPPSPSQPTTTHHPENLTHTTSPLSTLPQNSIDVITTHTLPTDPPAFLRACHGLLKKSGYLELTLVDRRLTNAGPITCSFLPHPHTPPAATSRSVLRALNALGPNGEGLFDQVKTCDVWMPTTSIGDELSTVTSRVGRCLYDELYANDGENAVMGVREMKVGELWRDAGVVEECARENTSFRWVKCYARKA